MAAFWREMPAASTALVDKDAGIGRHGFRLFCAAPRAGDRRLKHDGGSDLAGISHEEWLLEAEKSHPTVCSWYRVKQLVLGRHHG
jgi:hypothetical protein